ncbi:MAG: GerMN domain-containing protein [Clostridiales bacterium]|nr:GerMN domain-containing protein [Clostridiales bacterium]
MRKIMMPVLWLLAAAVLTGCAAAVNPGAAATPTATGTPTPTVSAAQSTATPTPAATVADYYPVRENTRYVYEGMGNEYASFTVYTEYASQDRMQQRVDNGGTVTARVIRRENGSVTRVLSSPEAYVRENLLDAPETEREVLLMEPLQAGTTWQVRDGVTRTITDMAVEVATPSGNYQALEVVTEGPGYKITDYYARDVGLVRTVYLAGEAEIFSTLSQIDPDVPLLQSTRFHYPGTQGDQVFYRRKELRFFTNDSATAMYEAACKEEPGGSARPLFSPGTKINRLTRAEDGTVLLDLNAAFLTEMNAGSSYEATILRCLAATFGQLYQSERLRLTIDGQPYRSGHIALGEGETLPVEYDLGMEIP